MKCNPLRRRYVIFTNGILLDDQTILSSIKITISPGIPPKVVYREGPFVVVRVDNISLEAARCRCGTPLSIDCPPYQLSSVSTSGTVKAAKEKIKKLRANLGVGDEEAVPVSQKSKDVDKKTD